MSAGEDDEPQNPLLQVVLALFPGRPLWHCHFHVTEATQRAARMTVSRPVMVLLAVLAVGACSRRPGGPEVTNARRELAELVNRYLAAS